MTQLSKANKVLLVEDDRLLSRLYSAYLRHKGYQVMQLFQGSQVVEEAREFQPHIIVLDLIMPDIDGFKILQAINNHEELKKIPVCVLSNLGQEEDIKKAKQLGANRFLNKSEIEIEELDRHIQELIQKNT